MMSSEMYVAIVMIAPLVLVVIPAVLYLSISKRKNPVMLGFIIAGIHLAFVLCMATHDYFYRSVVFRYRMDVDCLSLLDMPVSLILYSFLMFQVFFGGPGWLYNPFAFFAVLGSAQYFLWGFLLGHLFAIFRHVLCRSIGLFVGKHRRGIMGAARSNLEP